MRLSINRPVHVKLCIVVVCVFGENVDDSDAGLRGDLELQAVRQLERGRKVVRYKLEWSNVDLSNALVAIEIQLDASPQAAAVNAGRIFSQVEIATRLVHKLRVAVQNRVITGIPALDEAAEHGQVPAAERFQIDGPVVPEDG